MYVLNKWCFFYKKIMLCCLVSVVMPLQSATANVYSKLLQRALQQNIFSSPASANIARQILTGTYGGINMLNQGTYLAQQTTDIHVPLTILARNFILYARYSRNNQPNIQWRTNVTYPYTNDIFLAPGWLADCVLLNRAYLILVNAIILAETNITAALKLITPIAVAGAEESWRVGILPLHLPTGEFENSRLNHILSTSQSWGLLLPHNARDGINLPIANTVYGYSAATNNYYLRQGMSYFPAHAVIYFSVLNQWFDVTSGYGFTPYLSFNLVPEPDSMVALAGNAAVNTSPILTVPNDRIANPRDTIPLANRQVRAILPGNYSYSGIHSEHFPLYARQRWTTHAPSLAPINTSDPDRRLIIVTPEPHPIRLHAAANQACTYHTKAMAYAE